jgi:apolipoprotein N-acyltransferase
MLAALAQGVMLSHGWTRHALTFGSGAAGALAMAPFNLFPALVITLTVAVWLLDGAAEVDARQRWVLSSARLAALDGWWLGFGYYVAGLWWVGDAFLVEADRFAWALPLGVLGLPAILALFTAFGFIVARLLWTPGAARILALAVGLGSSEWLRGHLFTGFPWNLFGMALGGNLVLAQAASLVGVYGLTLVAIPVFAAPAILADKSANEPPIRWPAFAAAAVLATLALFGALRLGLGSGPGYVPGIHLRIMQPNLRQDAKFRPEYRDMILEQYLSLSDRATSPRSVGLSDVTHLIWPESAFPFILARDAQALARIGAALPSRTTLITGAARMDAPTAAAGTGGSDVYNAVQVVASGGAVLDSSDKVHLVPFGEYLPFGNLLNGVGLRQFVAIPGGFQAGARRKALDVPGLPLVSPLVCYEAIFSGEVIPQIWPSGREKRPGLLLNVTNDGWFGRYVGPYQHFAQARLRGIEEGLPLVRAANTGISAVVDAYGRVLEELPTGIEGVLDARLPARIEPTFFARFGNIPALGLFILMLMVVLVARLRH